MLINLHQQRRATCGNVANGAHLRRMYHSAGKDHFYTISGWDELEYSQKGYVTQTLNAGFIFQFSTEATALVPLYRLYQNATQTHLYTTSPSLRQTLLTTAQPPFVDDGPWGGITGYVYPDGSCSGTVPLLWASNPLTTDNYYTINTAEYNTFIANGYTAKGPIAWVYPVRKCRGILIERLFLDAKISRTASNQIW